MDIAFHSVGIDFKSFIKVQVCNSTLHLCAKQLSTGWNKGHTVALGRLCCIRALQKKINCGSKRRIALCNLSLNYLTYNRAITIEVSELISAMLRREGIVHEVLNAKFHEREAQIVAQAGQVGAVTVATNMAGRGTDIKLGEGVAELGGLKIIGTERHESRRIDNQLRGRSGRQGDPGVSRFYVSLEDDLLRIFGGERMNKMLETFRVPEDTPIEDKMFTKAIENAQKRVEENNFGIRKHLLEYDQVMNEQRETIYAERRRVLEGENLKPEIIKMIDGLVDQNVDEVATAEAKYPEEWDMAKLTLNLSSVIPFGKITLGPDDKDITADQFKDRLKEKAHQMYEAKEKEIDEDMPGRMREVERMILLRSVDTLWTDHLDIMDQMRQGIGLQAFAQKNPLDEYRLIGYDMFDELNHNIVTTTVRSLYAVHLVKNEEVERKEVGKNISMNHGGDDSKVKKPVRRMSKKIGRNDPCPCGSGKKYKNCHGRFDAMQDI